MEKGMETGHRMIMVIGYNLTWASRWTSLDRRSMVFRTFIWSLHISHWWHLSPVSKKSGCIWMWGIDLKVHQDDPGCNCWSAEETCLEPLGTDVETHCGQETRLAPRCTCWVCSSTWSIPEVTRSTLSCLPGSVDDLSHLTAVHQGMFFMFCSVIVTVTGLWFGSKLPLPPWQDSALIITIVNAWRVPCRTKYLWS
jgi:hypothetical protein